MKRFLALFLLLTSLSFGQVVQGLTQIEGLTQITIGPTFTTSISPTTINVNANSTAYRDGHGSKRGWFQFSRLVERILRTSRSNVFLFAQSDYPIRWW